MIRSQSRVGRQAVQPETSDANLFGPSLIALTHLHRNPPLNLDPE